jgi:hypothetical protein
VFSVASARPAAAGCDSEARSLRLHLQDADERASLWNNAWRITFAAAAAGQFVIGATRDSEDRDMRDFFYVGGVKASLATLSRLLMPVTVEIPPAAADACGDVRALRLEVENTGRSERQIFWVSHASAILFNTVGAIWLGEKHSWSLGLRSVAVSYPVGLLSTYTMPRASWHLWRDHRATWTVTAGDDGFLIGFGGTL